MKVWVLVDNLAKEGLTPEWGLALWIEHRGHKLLLDGGTTGVFAENARRMGIDLNEAELAVLSHAHYDHADGLSAFFAANNHAKLYLRAQAGENCYDCSKPEPRYIGIRPGFLEQYRDRLCPVEGDWPLYEGAALIPHKTPNLADLGRKIGMCVQRGGKMCPECFDHEQSLVLDTERGLVVFNSCCHGGPDNILAEVGNTYPGRPLYALIGGLHQFKSSDEEVRALAKRLAKTGVQQIYTGHCTGEHGLELLREELGECVHQMYAGMEITL